MFHYKKIFVGVLLACSLNASAQQELMLYNQQYLWQSNGLNPAYFPQDKKIAIGLAGIGLNAGHSGDISYNDVFIEKNGRTVVSFANAILKLEENNQVGADQRIETIQLGVRLPGGWRVFGGHANRLTATLHYPKSLAELIWYGNAPYIGKTVEIAPFANIFDWNEWSAGLSKRIGHVSVGGRVKYLTGVTALQTDPDRQQASVFTDPDIYQLNLQSNYAFHTSGLISAIDTSGLGFDIKLADFNNPALFTNNRGIAFDLGVQASVMQDRLHLSASILDLGGSIQWSENARYFHSQGSYEYKGVNFPGQDIINGTTDLNFDTRLDTLNDIFQFKSEDQKFKTRLPLQLYAGASFDFTKRLTAGVTLFHQSIADRNETAVALNGRWKPLSWLAVNGQYSIDQRSSSNIGLGLAFTPGPVQLYFFSDNIANAFSVRSKPAIHFRTGIAVVLK